ncbi:MAG: hypothetical protein M0D57_09100 [Sphingobacteriales bacterium JAD_PAG50586_3]|nr:MAG: hypothetical protein M0D57_09100 [Sphingobacteriales bacterium JAD_PAG50586_3]
MKTIRLVGILSIVAVLLSTSCGVEKRRYRKGFNVKKDTKNEKSDIKDTQTTTTTEPAKTTTTTATPEKKVEQPATTTVSSSSGTYTFKVVEGPRKDKKGKKKYPMNMR